MDDAYPVVFLIAGLVGLLWSARRYDFAVKRYKTQLAISAELQQQSQAQLDRADEQQRRQLEMLDRQEAILARVEALASRFEMRPRD